MPEKKASAHRKPWTDAQVRKLEAYAEAGTPLAEIARALKRTEAAVREKASTLGIRLGRNR